jgi:hypothetical protein
MNFTLRNIKKKVVSTVPLHKVSVDLFGLCPPMHEQRINQTQRWGHHPSNSSDMRVMVSRGDLHSHMGFEPWERPDTPHIPKVKVSIIEQRNLHIHLVRD